MEKEIKEKRGGKRLNAGRPKVKDKKVQIDTWIEGSIVDSYGGKKPLKKLIYKAAKDKRL